MKIVTRTGSVIEMTQIDYDYFEWLTSQINVPNRKTCNDLFERMHNLEFVWIVPNDDNRVQDGLDLRSEFVNGSRRKLNLKGVSFLEVLVGLSRRVAFTAGGDSRNWAWRLIKNIKLNKMSDPLTAEKANKVDEVLNTLIWRTYQKDGRGGFFPLNQIAEDQTKVEIWYQMNAYVIETQAL
jgi:hypothetical protein